MAIVFLIGMSYIHVRKSMAVNVAVPSVRDISGIPSEWTYPRLTVDGENINNMVVDFSLGAKRIDDDCGTVVEVEVSFRETRQMGS